ncbi:MAG: valine--tRNA ligase [Acidobacteriota bacterium]|nr:valine--tRNA ligase [Acidobacteriota bacterium]
MTLEKAFSPERYEARVGRMWEASGLFAAHPEQGGPRFSLVIPPPNVTGSLHIGHALDYTLQDIIVRWHRMLGEDAVWVPGCDHAGIATQMVVERELAKEGRDRHEIGREAFVEEVWKWKEQYRERIMGTLRRLGCSCDWSRERFTLDPGFSKAVRETFVRLHEEGLIYRGTRLINWSPALRTSLSDLEVDRDEPEKGEMWSFAYPIEGGGEIVVATTRPETMLGDTAVAVHPDDERWQAVIGKRLLHPFFPERNLRVIADPILADPTTGTGAVKVTPAHDFNDFECGRRHDLEMIDILTEDGKINEAGGAFAGLDRFEAREAVKKALTDKGLFRGRKDHFYAPGRCQRSGVIVEPRLSTQWFVKMEPLARPAIEAVRSGKIRFVPSSWEKTYYHWLENIQDWCVSRQLWWGHRIPAWYCDGCGEVMVVRQAPEVCRACGGGELRQDPDVLDTWFSSQLWPFGVFGWPEKGAELERYYPTDTLVTGFDIIFFWVARMIMSGLHLVGEVPFRTVLFHGMVRDARGVKMSKTKGNAVDPSSAMDEHGVDALRFTLAALASPGSDLALSEERLTGYRAFLNKLWNATRFLLMQVEGGDFRRLPPEELELDALDHYLLASYRQLVGRVHASFQAHRYDHACEAIYHFLWHTFCDWCIELSKPDFAGKSEGDRKGSSRLTVMIDVLDGALRLLHPVAPFITEELWQSLPRREGDAALLAASRIPTPDDPGVPIPEGLDDGQAIALVEQWLIAPVSAARALKTGAGIAPGKEITLRLRPRRPEGERALRVFAGRIAGLVKAREVDLLATDPPEEPALRQVLDTVEVIIPMAGALDLEQEKARLQKERDKLAGQAEACRRKLSNASFVERAPAAVVDKERARLEDLESRLASLAERLESFG